MSDTDDLIDILYARAQVRRGERCKVCGQDIRDDTPAFAVDGLWQHYECHGLHLDVPTYLAFAAFKRGEITQEQLTKVVRERKAKTPTTGKKDVKMSTCKKIKAPGVPPWGDADPINAYNSLKTLLGEALRWMRNACCGDEAGEDELIRRIETELGTPTTGKGKS